MVAGSTIDTESIGLVEDYVNAVYTHVMNNTRSAASVATPAKDALSRAKASTRIHL